MHVSPLIHLVSIVAAFLIFIGFGLFALLLLPPDRKDDDDELRQAT